MPNSVLSFLDLGDEPSPVSETGHVPGLFKADARDCRAYAKRRRKTNDGVEVDNSARLLALHPVLNRQQRNEKLSRKSVGLLLTGRTRPSEHVGDAIDDPDAMEYVVSEFMGKREPAAHWPVLAIDEDERIISLDPVRPGYSVWKREEGHGNADVVLNCGEDVWDRVVQAKP